MTQTSHKVYMNHVHSSTLLSQLSTMWKSQTLCDAIIKTGPISTKVTYLTYNFNSLMFSGTCRALSVIL